MDVATIYTTFGTRQEAESVAEILLEERWIACANTFPEVTSVFRWDGKIQKTSEVVMLGKTRRTLAAGAVERIRTLHSYDCPCILIWGADGGYKEFARWVHDETVRPGGCEGRGTQSNG